MEQKRGVLLEPISEYITPGLTKLPAADVLAR